MVEALNTLATEAPAGGAMQWQVTAMASKLGEPINTDCPIKPGRPIDPSLLALNEDGETVGFCCNLALISTNATWLPKNPTTPSSTSSASTVNYVRDQKLSSCIRARFTLLPMVT